MFERNSSSASKKNFFSGTKRSLVPFEQLVSLTLPERETTASNLFDFPSSMCKVRHTSRHVFGITSSYLAGNRYTVGSPKRSSYVAERTRKLQNKFTNSFTGSNFNYSSLALDGGSLKENNGCSQWFLSREFEA